MNALNPNEVAIIQMALQAFVEDNKEISSNPSYPFTPEARAMMKDMLATAISALAKIALASGRFVKLGTYNEGDEEQFYTKQS